MSATKTVQCHDCQDTGVTGWSFPCDCAKVKTVNDQRIEQLTHCADIANRTDRFDISLECLALVGSITTGDEWEPTKVNGIADMLEPITENVALHLALMLVP